MKNKSLCMLSAMLIVIIIFGQITLGVSALTSQMAKFTVGSIGEAKKGNSYEIPVTIEAVSGSNLRIGGILLSISYDTSRLKYKSSSEQFGKEFFGASVHHDAASGKISIAWDNDTSISLSGVTEFLRLNFTVADSATDGIAQVKLDINSCYSFSVENERVIWDDIHISNTSPVGTFSIVSSADSSAITNVITAINNIGTVEYTDACLNVINAAKSAYLLLTQAQKDKVTNYSVLTAAGDRYEQLKTAAQDKLISDEIDAFYGKYGNTLALTSTTVTLTDKSAVNNAIKDYNLLSTGAKYKLFELKAHLENLAKQIKQLESEASNAEKIAQLKLEAADYAKSFREEKKYFLNLKPDDITSADYYAGLSDAMGTLQTLTEMNPYVEDLLSEEKKSLQVLLDKAEEIMENSGNKEDSVIVAANKFKRTFAYVLSLKKDGISAEDKLDIALAYEIYDMLDEDVKNYISEQGTLLKELYNAVMDMEENSGDETEDEPGDEEDTEKKATDGVVSKTVIKDGKPGNIKMNYLYRKIGTETIILFSLLIASCLILVLLQLYYHLVIKKIFKTGSEGYQQEQSEGEEYL